MKMEFLKKGTALFIALVMMACAFAVTVGAETTAAEAPAENQEPCVIIPASEMNAEKLTPNAFSSAELVDYRDTKLLKLSVIKNTNDPYVGFEIDGEYSADVYKYAMLLVRADVQTNNTIFEMFYGTEGNGNVFKGGCSQSARYAKMSTWQFLVFDFTEKKEWTGNIKKVRFDFFSGAEWPAGLSCEIAGLVFSSDVEGLYEAANDLLLTVCPPVQRIADFTEGDISHLSSPATNTGVALSEGNLRYLSMGEHKDPSAVFNYDTLAAARGIKALTTDDFRYTVMRYRTSMNVPSTTMELFIMTGGTKSLMDMIRIKGTYSCHSGEAKYQNTRTWRGVMVDMAEDDGLDKNTALKYGWQGRGEFNGFRFDWCGTGAEGAYMEISEFLFFASKADAQAFTNALNTLNIPLPVDVEEIEKETYETEHVVMPWETETETEVPTETLPVFVEETTERVTEEKTETESVETEPVETEPAETEDETQKGGVDTEDFGGIDISGGDDTVEDKGSETPFLIACIALICLSIASIVTVIVIRAKEKA